MAGRYILKKNIHKYTIQINDIIQLKNDSEQMR